REKLREHGRGSDFEGRAVPEPRRLVRGQRIDHLRLGQRVRPLHHLYDEGAHRWKTGFAYEGCESRLDQILLARFEGDRGFEVDESTDEVELGIGQRHDRPPTGSGRRWAATRSTMAGAIAVRGRTASASPAWATAPGMPHT